MWDGLDDRGARAQAGSYRVRAVGIAGGTSRPVVRIN
jgi:flagellar hook assembly protein FlgD